MSLAVHDRRTETHYAAMLLGHFGPKLRSRQMGDSEWTELTLPEYPTDSGATLKEIWAITPGGPDNPGRLWLGTIPGGVFKSDDGGSSWQLVKSLWNRPERSSWFGGGTDEPVVNSIVVDPRDTNTVFVAVSCGGIWKTTDDGASWKLRSDGMQASYMPPDQAGLAEIQDIHRLALCASSPDCMWAQHHDRIYVSLDGGMHWKSPQAPISGFGFGVAVNPHDPQMAWFRPADSDQTRVPVGNRVVVQRTNDGGDTFDVLTEGLPQEYAFDIILRHALEVNDSGQWLAMG